MGKEKSSKKRGTRFIAVLAIVGITSVWAVAAKTQDEADKVLISTSSQEALEFYLEGRDLAEKLRGPETLEFFEKAVAADPDLAMAHLNLAFAQPSAKGFFEHLEHAVSLVDKASEGERLWILGVEAGVNGLPMRQREYYQELVTAYPNDERVHGLLGNHYFGQQEYLKAISYYEKAIEINPEFVPPYNMLGYSRRALGHYSEAEEAFKKYVELIPDDPNPHDSYAELLLKMGEYEASIEHYQKALSIDPNFAASHIGIATNLNLMQRHQDARAQLQKMHDTAVNDGQRRQAFGAMAVSYVDEGDIDQAFVVLDKRYALAEKIDDAAAMAGDLQTIGNILLEAGQADNALAKFEKSLTLIRESDRSEEIKESAERVSLFNTARVALKKGDVATAKAKLEEFRQQVQAIDNPSQIRQSHELAGMIALEEKDYDTAIAELGEANQQNPYNHYRLAQAYEGKGDTDKAKELYNKAANFNALNNLNYAFIRGKAQQRGSATT